jgi:HSP20 family protein
LPASALAGRLRRANPFCNLDPGQKSSGSALFGNRMEDMDMVEAVKLPVQAEQNMNKSTAVLQTWSPFRTLRREMDRLMDEFDSGWHTPFRNFFNIEPIWRREIDRSATPAVDIVAKDGFYEVTAELPGMDEKNLEVKLANGGLVIRGEKKAEREEKKKDYWLQERSFGTFERYFRLPEGVDTDKIEASFKNGVLTVRLPKTTEAQKSEKKIAVKAA